MSNVVYLRKVVTKNFIADFIAVVQNFLGLNLVSYESLIDKGMEQINKEITDKKLKMKWFRLEITELTNGSLVLLYYGEKK